MGTALLARGSYRPRPATQGGPPAIAPSIVSFSPTSGLAPTTITVNLANMPPGFTLTSVNVNGVALDTPTKVSDTQITGVTNVGHTTGLVRVVFAGGSQPNISSGGLTPSVFTVA